MSDDKIVESPVPLPRTKLPVPRPRTKIVTSDEQSLINDNVNSSSESLEKSRSGCDSDKEVSMQSSGSLKSLNRSTLRKSLRLVTSNVQEKSSAVLENTKLVGAKIEKSMRSMLKRNSGASQCESDVKSPYDVDFNDDNVFSDIKFGSPIVNEERSLPPPYPPPPLPDSFYDDLSSIKSSPPESHYSYPSFPTRTDAFYEEIPFLKKLNLTRGNETDSSSNASIDNSSCLKSDSWNFVSMDSSSKEANLKTTFALSTEVSSSPSTSDSGRPCTEQSEVIHSYENFMPSKVPPSKFTVNVYSEMPAKADRVRPKSPLSIAESIGSKSQSNSIYENWGPIVGEDLSPLEVKNNGKPLLLHSDTLISEFDPLLKDNPLLQKIYESRIKSNAHPFDVCDDDSEDSGKRTNTTVPENENFYEMASNCSEGESVADLTIQSHPVDLSLNPGDSSTLESSKKRIARWSSMKEAVRKVYDKTNRRKSESWELPPKPPACLHTSLHTGYLYKLTSMTDNPKNLMNKWCTIGEGKLSFCIEKSSAPKDILLLDNIIAIQLILDPKSSESGEVIHCWELVHCSKGKPCIVGCTAPTERRIWMQKILESLTQVFPTSLSSSYTRTGWAYLRESSIGPWSIVWLLLQKRNLHISFGKGKNFELDLRKMINLEYIVKGEYDEIVVDTQDKSYRLRTLKDLKAWSKVIKAAAVDNGTSLAEQQLTKDNVPTIVEICVNFVYAHGCMSEGIYRRNGSNANIQRLLTDLRKDAWSVRISQQEYSEHDVSTALKRFFRDLPDPLFTKEHHDYLCNASSIKCNKSDKISMYRNCLEKLPLVNYVTARKLISHLHYISLQAEKNLMTCENIAAIWAPTLLQVQDSESAKWSKQEFQVILDLITYFKPVFVVGESEVAIERRILEVLEKVHKRGGPNHHDPSGNLKIWVYINSKESGDCINISVDPDRSAGDVVNELCSKRAMESHECCLQEVCLSGALIRPLHHTESVFQTVIRWAYWHHAHRKDNYLVVTHNLTFKQIAAAIVTPQLTKSGELKFAGPKMKSFKTHMFEFSQAKLSYFKDSKFNNKLGEWPVEDVVFYMGQDPKRTSNTKWSLTLVPKGYQSEASNKEWFGYTLAGCHDDLLEWLSAFHLAQYGAAEVLPRPTVSRLVS